MNTKFAWILNCTGIMNTQRAFTLGIALFQLLNLLGTDWQFRPENNLFSIWKVGSLAGTKKVGCSSRTVTSLVGMLYSVLIKWVASWGSGGTHTFYIIIAFYVSLLFLSSTDDKSWSYKASVRGNEFVLPSRVKLQSSLLFVNNPFSCVDPSSWVSQICWCLRNY